MVTRIIWRSGEWTKSIVVDDYQEDKDFIKCGDLRIGKTAIITIKDNYNEEEQ